VRWSADERAVGARTAAVIPRVVVIVAAGLFASATITFAAGTALHPRSSQHRRLASSPHLLVVPDVRRQVFVFAKGMLEDEGFGWQVQGSVHGYPSNTVASQSPAPGMRVIDTGAPKITLELSRNAKYAEVGKPEDRSPYGASPVRVFRSRAAKRRSKPAVVTRHTKARLRPKRAARRQPAFVVPGAPPEPLHEMALPVRAHRLATWLERHQRPTEANVHHWLYQHAWIVTGARFGWSGGAQALAILIKVDRRTDHLWGIGSNSRRIARQALREVRRRAR
jgi:hypothetical protein